MFICATNVHDYEIDNDIPEAVVKAMFGISVGRLSGNGKLKAVGMTKRSIACLHLIASLSL